MNENLAYWQLNFTSKPSKFSPRLHGHAGKIQEPRRPQTPGLLYSSACSLRPSTIFRYFFKIWSHPCCQSLYRSGDLLSYNTQCGRYVVQVLVVRVDIGVVTYDAMTPQCGRSVVQVLVVRVDIGVVTFEAMIPQC